MMDLDAMACSMLGLPLISDHRRLLGVPIHRTDAIAVETALRRRLAQLRVHPNGNSLEADDIRTYLRQIASDLIQTFPQHPSPSSGGQPEMTPLDRAILAALIGDGGWNRKSRSRLVAIAASYSISVNGLMRILEALAASARSGDGPLAANRRSFNTMNRSWITLPAKKSALSRVDEIIGLTAKKLTPELHSPNPVMTLKLAVVFGLLTLIAFILSLQVLLSSDVAWDQWDGTATQKRFIPPPMTSEAIASDQHKLFDQYPTFKQDVSHQVSINAADIAVTLPHELSILTTTIEASFLRGELPQEVWRTTWNDAASNTALGWAFLDAMVLEAISDQMIEVLLQAEQQQSFANSLIAELQIPALRFETPVTLFQKIWTTGILARISCDQRLSALSRAAARRMQSPSITTCDEEEARSLSLPLIAGELAQMTEYESKVFAIWEHWIISVQHITIRSSFNELTMVAIEHLLSTSVDLSRRSNTRKVLGRLVHEMEWASDSVGRDHIDALYNDPATISDDLWVLGHLFLLSDKTSWFTSQHLVLPTTTLAQRGAIASKLVADWPVESTSQKAVWSLALPAGFDPILAKEWKARYRNTQHVQGFDPSSIARLRILNEAAVALWRGRPDVSKTTIDKFDNLDLAFIEPERSQILHPDGAWSEKFYRSRIDIGHTIEVLDFLLSTTSTDLGVIDANTLASAALTQMSSRIRLNATNVIINQFGNGSNVAIAILNHLSKSRSKQHVASLVANLTDVILPPLRDSRWTVDAHRALVQHALTVSHDGLRELDVVSNEVASSLIAELLLLDPTILPPSKGLDTNDSLRLLVDAWKRTLPHSYLPAWELDFNPTGTMQEYLQLQLEYLQLIRAEEMRWRGGKPYVPSDDHSIDIGNEYTNIVGQIAQVELSIARHWDRIIGDLITQYKRKMQ